MKKVSALVLIASLVLLVILWITHKFTFNTNFLRDLNFVQWLSAFLKTIVVLVAYIGGFFAMILITFVDIVSSLIWNVEFPILNLVYDKFFLGFSKDWYWDQFPGAYLFISGLLLMLISIIILALPDTKRKARSTYNHAHFSSRA